MSEPTRYSWEQPPRFTCASCGAKAEGALTSGDMFGSGAGHALPVGWCRGYDRIEKRVVEVCSGACGNAVMMGPPGDGTNPKGGVKP